jgi:hypothetical protein
MQRNVSVAAYRLQNLLSAQLVKKFFGFNGAIGFITLFTTTPPPPPQQYPEVVVFGLNPRTIFLLNLLYFLSFRLYLSPKCFVSVEKVCTRRSNVSCCRARCEGQRCVVMTARSVTSHWNMTVVWLVKKFAAPCGSRRIILYSQAAAGGP